MDTYLRIDEITKEMKSWVAVITVQEKMQPTQSPRSPTRMQKFIFADSRGAKVEAMVFNKEIERMGTKIEVYKTYRISNAEVTIVPEKYRIDGIEKKWIVSSKTVIEELESERSMLLVNYKYTPFTDLGPFVDVKDKSVDVIAVVVRSLPVNAVDTPFGKSNVQKFILVDEHMNSVMLSVWNSFIENEARKINDLISEFPVVICRRLKVVFFNGVALSTNYDTAILVDPPVEEAFRLKNWAARSQMALSDFVKANSYMKSSVQLDMQSIQKPTLVANLLPTDKIAVVKVLFSFENISQHYWYMACKKCFCATAAAYDFLFTCNSCNKKQKAEPRCRIEMDLIYASGIITATVFGELAEKILSVTAIEAMQCTEQNRELPLGTVHKDLENKKFFAQIKQAKRRDMNGGYRYIVVHFAAADEKQPSGMQLSVEGAGSSQGKSVEVQSTANEKQTSQMQLSVEGAESSQGEYVQVQPSGAHVRECQHNISSHDIHTCVLAKKKTALSKAKLSLLARLQNDPIGNTEGNPDNDNPLPSVGNTKTGDIEAVEVEKRPLKRGKTKH